MYSFQHSRHLLDQTHISGKPSDCRPRVCGRESHTNGEHFDQRALDTYVTCSHPFIYQTKQQFVVRIVNTLLWIQFVRQWTSVHSKFDRFVGPDAIRRVLFVLVIMHNFTWLLVSSGIGLPGWEILHCYQTVTACGFGHNICGQARKPPAAPSNHQRHLARVRWCCYRF